MLPGRCRAHGSPFPCHRVHFRRLVFPWTDVGMGNCSYLDTCRHMKTCRFVHYELDDDGSGAAAAKAPPGAELAGAGGVSPRAAAGQRPSVPAYLAVRSPCAPCVPRPHASIAIPPVAGSCPFLPRRKAVCLPLTSRPGSVELLWSSLRSFFHSAPAPPLSVLRKGMQLQRGSK